MLAQEGQEISLVTIKRELSRMTSAGLLTASGRGRSRAYAISVAGRIFSDVDASRYFDTEPDRRVGLAHYNFDLFPSFPSDIFTPAELVTLDAATAAYRVRTTDVPKAVQKKELERLIVELSWKSSRIEGNTYTLLDTEKLILEHKEALGHDKKEARMILNHKDAFTFVREHKKEFRTLTRAHLEEVHRMVVKDLGVGTGLRKKPVGVTGSKYRPLDTQFQIREAVEALASAVTRVKSPYAKALLAVLGISYIQPFDDGNKRTGRIMANAILLAHHCAPLSYRSVVEREYQNATLVFYELNSLSAFKVIFIEQYVFAANNYLVK